MLNDTFFAVARNELQFDIKLQFIAIILDGTFWIDLINNTSFAIH